MHQLNLERIQQQLIKRRGEMSAEVRTALGMPAGLPAPLALDAPFDPRQDIVIWRASDLAWQWMTLLEPLVISGRLADAAQKMSDLGSALLYRLARVERISRPRGFDRRAETIEAEIQGRRAEVEALLVDFILRGLGRLDVSGVLSPREIEVEILQPEVSPDSVLPWLGPGCGLRPKLRLGLEMQANTRLVESLRVLGQRRSPPIVIESVSPMAPDQPQRLSLLDWFMIGVAKGALTMFLHRMRWNQAAVPMPQAQMLLHIAGHIVTNCRRNEAKGTTSVSCVLVGSS